jgi:hypothetical protein
MITYVENIQDNMKSKYQIVDLIPTTYLKRFNENSFEFSEYPLVIRGNSYNCNRCEFNICLNDIVESNSYERILLKVNYTKRLLTRQRYLRSIVKRIAPFEDIEKYILSYILFESPLDLFIKVKFLRYKNQTNFMLTDDEDKNYHT